MKSVGCFIVALSLAAGGAAQTPEWIWFQKTDEAETRYFRKTFAVESTVPKAILVATADDALEVFLNGERVLSADQWQHGHVVTLTNRVTAGTNVLAVRAINGDGSPAGVVLKLTLDSGSDPRVLVSDGSWKASDRERRGWRRTDFDDTTWEAAASLGRLGKEPWGAVFATTLPGAARPLGSGGGGAVRVAPPADQLAALPGFRVELVTGGGPEEGSWVNLCRDPGGRLIVSPQYPRANPDAGLLRLTLGPDGSVAKREFIARPLYDAQGMCFAHGALWVVVNRYSTGFESGLYRITDDGSDTWQQITLVKALPGGGEHGPHAVALGPDGQLWVLAGNHTQPPEGLAAQSPHRHYAEDLLLPRRPDGNGHATGIMAPGGYILRVSPEATTFELFCGGFRNAYDFAFNVDGELFAWDADMEYDWGVPWYRPTRVNHAVSGAEFGWRYGTGKWPAYHADSLGAVVDVGLGSPTGMTSGTGAKFPAKYQRALYVLDWTYGRLMAVHLEPDGASYTATWENFVAPAGLVTPDAPKPPLNLTDAIIGSDGAMYFTVGGRNTASGLYRVTYHGTEPVTPSVEANTVGADARATRRRLEAFHGRVDPGAVEALWPSLNSPDRVLRHAARIALESQPVDVWKDRALAETSADAGLTASLALARVGGAALQEANLRGLGRWPLATLSERQQLDKLRIIQVSLARNGLPSAGLVAMASERLGRSYPSASALVNRELAQVLIALGAPDVVEKTLTVMARAATQEELMHYLFHLRTARNWTLDQRREYLGYWIQVRDDQPHEPELLLWFEQAGRPYSNGASFNNFLKNFLADATAGLDGDEAAALEPLMASIASGATGGSRVREFPAARERPLIKAWTLEELEEDLEAVGRGRDFENGRQAFVDAQCLACHRFGREGGGAGPDLTAVAARFSRRDVLESILDPSRVLSEQYQNTAVTLKDGEEHVGRLLQETTESLVLMTDPLEPGSTVTLRKADIVSRAASKVSPMPEGLVNGLGREDLLDLLAFIESSGRRHHPAFTK
ncbi:MAG: c-type cytochrome [Verrucomicrobiae bacterium]|nr:c-type cytochrome [Verrucomicrobiae bacterium]